MANYSDQKENFQAKYIYIIEIDVIKGIKLVAADMGGKSDPYVSVLCGNRKFKTIVCKKTLDPAWNAHTQFQFYQEPKEIKFVCKDWDKVGSNDPLGDYTLSLAGMFKTDSKPFEGCVTLDNIKRGEIEIKVECKRLSPHELIKNVQKLTNDCKENRTKIAKCDTQIANANDKYKKLDQEYPSVENGYNAVEKQCQGKKQEKTSCERTGYTLDNEIDSLKQEIQDLTTQLKNIKAEKKAVKRELQEMQGKYNQAEERKHRYMDSQGNVDNDKLQIYTRIETYGNQFKKTEEDSDEEYDDGIAKDIVIGYATKTREANGYQAQAAQYADEGEDKADECEEENRKYQKANTQAMQYLQDIKRWNQRVTEELERRKDRCLVEMEYTDSNNIEFFAQFFKALCKFFFNTQIVAATLEEFGDEIKKRTGKKASKCTFYDVAGGDDTTGGNDSDYDDDGDEQKELSLWKSIYSDLDFVVDELNALLSETVKNKPLQNLCNNAREFMKVYYGGNYPRFAYNVSWAACEIITDPESDNQLTNPTHITEDALGVIVSIFTDKKNFAKSLFLSMQSNTKYRTSNDDSDDDDDEEEKCADTDAFETIISQIVVSVASIIDKIGSDLLSEEDWKLINKQKDCVLQKASELNIDAKSCKIIENFFGYFFSPQSGGCCECGGDEGGIMGFFGSIFGGMCK